jgi:hypothetical protein
MRHMFFVLTNLKDHQGLRGEEGGMRMKEG